MKFLVIIVLAIVALVLIKLKSQYRMQITAGFFLIIIVLNTVYNGRSVSAIMPFIHPVNQLTYQPEFLERMEFPDALIPLIIENKTIYVKKDKETSIDDVVARGMSWFYKYMHYHGTVNYIKGIGADVMPDESLNESVVTSDMLGDFADLGYANDMYRNVCMYTGKKYVDLNYFGHYWYYNMKIAPMHIYINPDGLYDADELVWLWQPVSVTHELTEEEKLAEFPYETEYMFIMSKEYYDSKF